MILQVILMGGKTAQYSKSKHRAQEVPRRHRAVHERVTSMYQIDFSHPVSVHFIGIGGISMSGLATVLADAGFTVTGSDSRASSLTDQLAASGIGVLIGQRAENIPDACDVVVYTAAVHTDNPEYQEAVRRNIPMLTRAQLLGELMRNYRISVAVSGTHGKTTTTSMLSQITMEAGVDPTISVGGILPAIGGNIRVGGPGLFITEACEYTNSFLSLFPTVGIILNIEEDHLDFFKDLADIRSSFRKFAQLIPPEGALIINGAIEDLNQLTEGLPCRIITFGTGSSDYRAEQITHHQAGESTFSVISGHEGAPCDTFTIHVPGAHNISNALAAVAASDFLGIPRDITKKGLASFSGTDRRFEHKGMYHEVTVIDDYAHHPTEIRATLTAAKEYPHRELWCAFQSHTYSRTKTLFDDFIDALSLADHVLIAPIYPARETDTLGMSGELMAQHLRQAGCDAVSFSSFEEIARYAAEHCKAQDLLITMGAGDIYRAGDILLEMN